MARSGRTVVKLEEKVLEFEFEIQKVQYNKQGRFFLKLSIQNEHRKDLLKKVTVDINDSGVQKPGVTLTTDTVESGGDVNFVKYQTKKFKYNLPKGFCKNDGHYDVYLLIEVYRVPVNNRKREPERIGEAKFAIYPRTEIPRANLFVSKGEDYYHYSGIITLLRPLTRASISMHCGRLSYTVAFHEYREPGFVYQEPPDVNAETPVSEERHDEGPVTITVPSPKPTPSTNTPTQRTDAKANALRQANRQPPPVPPPEQNPVAKVQSVDRTTQWTPQEVPEPWTPEETLLSRDETFHISMPSTPRFDDTTPKRTMDSPMESNKVTSPTRSSLPKTRKRNPRQPQSQTFTSPIPNKEVGRKRPPHVSRPGFEDVYVIVHGATSLPSRSDGQDPLPFVSLKSVADERGGRKAQSSTHATIQHTHSPVWEEILMIEVPESSAEEEEVILTISDSATKEKLVTYRVPMKNLVPFHPYHFELVQPTKSIGSGIRAYVTVQRRGSHLPRLNDFSFCGLEVVLIGFHKKLDTSAGPLLAVARVVPDYTLYKERMLSKQSSGITTTTLTFPSPHPSTFEISAEHMQGFPQLTTVSKDGEQPSWQHTFMFCGNDTATMFAHNSALVIEYYSATTSMSTVTWTIRNPIGFSTLLLDNEVFEALASESGHLGVRVQDLLVQASQFRTSEGGLPGVDLVLRLVNTERPDSLTSVAELSLLPMLDSMPKPGTTGNPLIRSSSDSPLLLQQADTPELERESSDLEKNPPLYNRKKTQILVKEDEYPPSDILETILPEHVLTENDANRQPRKEKPTQGRTNQRMDNNTSSLTAHQARELQNYREAVKRMAADIASLRTAVANLQEENHSLRRELLQRNNLGDIIQNDIATGSVTTEEFADKFVAVKTQLDAEKGELKKYKDKVQHLQNQLIKANDREKNYLHDNVNLKQQEQALKKVPDKAQKMKKLESTCLQQEKVIQKMEKLLADYLKRDEGGKPQRIKDEEVSDPSKQMASLLTEENARLRMELENMKVANMHYEAENAQLEAKVEKAENRMNSLESQLEQNSRRWAQERHELTVRLQEHRNGYVRTTQPIAGDF